MAAATDIPVTLTATQKTNLASLMALDANSAFDCPDGDAAEMRLKGEHALQIAELMELAAGARDAVSSTEASGLAEYLRGVAESTREGIADDEKRLSTMRDDEEPGWRESTVACVATMQREVETIEAVSAQLAGEQGAEKVA